MSVNYPKIKHGDGDSLHEGDDTSAAAVDLYKDSDVANEDKDAGDHSH